MIVRCIRGECVEMEVDEQPVDGEWGPWSSWGPCSSSCGNTIKVSQRFCDSPSPSFGGNYCTGVNIRQELCALAACSSGNIRDTICQHHLNTSTAHSASRASSCLLQCKRDSHATEVSYIPIEDGVDCIDDEDMAGVCLYQQCVKIGCDGKLYSNFTEDLCGVCGGNNSTCSLISGYLSVSGPSENEYQEVMRIMEGASVTITSIGSRENLLALESVGRTRALNWDMLVKQPGQYKLGQTHLRYSRQDTGHEHTEIVDIRIVKAPVIVYILYRLPSSNISWQYYIHNDQVPMVEPPRWKYPAWSDCPVTCGDGLRTKRPVCTHDNKPVPSYLCLAVSWPQLLTKLCKLAPCKATWWSGPWQSCVSCQEPYKYRSVLCVGNNMEALQDIKCSQIERPEFKERCPTELVCGDLSESKDIISFNHSLIDLPISTEVIESAKEPAVYGLAVTPDDIINENWSDCSKSCGDGIKSRWMKCADCSSGSRLEMASPCNLGPCADWRLGEWSQCSPPCGNRTRVRSVDCSGVCDPESRPPDQQACAGIKCSRAGQCEDSLPTARCHRLLQLCGKQVLFSRMCCKTCYRKLKSIKDIN